ncbi:MAG: hypothetical protein LBE20_01225 [Deltaproteobacteria bacterium]|jgi:hypothetical protein|nr:hypothetical protein [Deltaproteobacteria bacterium]
MLNPIDSIIFVILNALGIVLAFVLIKTLWFSIKQLLRERNLAFNNSNKKTTKVNQYLKVIDLEIAKQKQKEKEKKIIH